MTNFYSGLNRGPIDHESSSVINSISNGAITMGSAVVPIAPGNEEILNRVIENPSLAVETKVYGIAVGGDTDGVYGDGNEAFTDANRATNSSGQGVVVCTQGRCLARVESTVPILLNDPLGSSGAGVGNEGVLINATGVTTSPVIARALQPSPDPGFHMIAVDVQRESGPGEEEPNLQAFFIPQVDVSTTSTTSFEITRGNNTTNTQNSMPWAGTIKRVLIGHTSTIGDGFVEIIRFPNGVSGSFGLGQVNYTGTPGIFTEKITYEKDFEQFDGLAVSFLGDAITTTTLTVTLEVEFDLA